VVAPARVAGSRFALQELTRADRTTRAAARIDHADAIGGGLSIRVGDGAVVALLYDNSRRRSTGGTLFNYDRRRVYTTITYGM